MNLAISDSFENITHYNIESSVIVVFNFSKGKYLESSHRYLLVTLAFLILYVTVHIRQMCLWLLCIIMKSNAQQKIQSFVFPSQLHCNCFRCFWRIFSCMNVNSLGKSFVANCVASQFISHKRSSCIDYTEKAYPFCTKTSDSFYRTNQDRVFDYSCSGNLQKQLIYKGSCLPRFSCCSQRSHFSHAYVYWFTNRYHYFQKESVFKFYAQYRSFVALREYEQDRRWNADKPSATLDP